METPPFDALPDDVDMLKRRLAQQQAIIDAQRKALTQHQVVITRKDSLIERLEEQLLRFQGYEQDKGTAHIGVKICAKLDAGL